MAESIPDATGFSGPLTVELPLHPLEAFRIASFGLEYVPQYAPVMVDRDCNLARIFNVPRELWPSTFPRFSEPGTYAYMGHERGWERTP